MKTALERDFSPENPYSKYGVALIQFKGPIYETHWENITGQMTEVIDRELDDKEAKILIRDYLVRVNKKANNFDSDIVKVWTIS